MTVSWYSQIRAIEHAMKFHPSKSKYTAVTSHPEILDRVHQIFYINNVPIERVKSWSQLVKIVLENHDESPDIYLIIYIIYYGQLLMMNLLIFINLFYYQQVHKYEWQSL